MMLIAESLSDPRTTQTVVGVLVIAVVALATGKFVMPRWAHNTIVANKDKEIQRLTDSCRELREERDEFKEWVRRMTETNQTLAFVTKQTTEKRGPS